MVFEEYELDDRAVVAEGVECIHEEDKAILVRDEGGDEDSEIWIPKSQVHSDSEVYKEDTEGRLVITRWFAEKKGLL